MSLGSHRVIVVGIGNEMRGDDAFGLLVARKLRQKGVDAVEAGSSPENFTGYIRRLRPSTVILVDCVDMRQPPGTVKILDPSQIDRTTISTHKASLWLLANFINKEFGARVILVGAQPKSFNGELSPEMVSAVERAVQLIEEYIRALLK